MLNRSIRREPSKLKGLSSVENQFSHNLLVGSPVAVTQRVPCSEEPVLCYTGSPLTKMDTVSPQVTADCWGSQQEDTL